MKKTSVLLIGESWAVHTVEAKGADVFTYDTYEVGTQYMQRALNTDDIEFHHMPCHMVQYEFPNSAAELLEKYDVILISDIGANTFLLPVKTFLHCQPTPNKLEILRDFVSIGGGVCMVGGYLSFMGMEGKGRYNNTPIEHALPVNFFPHDDRVELPQGAICGVDVKKHEILDGLDAKTPMIFGYNRATVKEDAQTVIAYEGDPILSVREYGKGRTAAYASDCGPHWCSLEFCESDFYKTMWNNIVKWLAKA